MQCARTAMTIKGSLHPLPAERWHCGLEHPPGLSVMMGSGYPEKQVLALFSAERTPPPQPFSTRPSLPALARGSCVRSPGSPLQWPSSARGRGPWGGGRAAPWDGGTGRLLPFSQRLELDTQVRGHCPAHIVQEPRDARRGWGRGPGAAPREARGSPRARRWTPWLRDSSCTQAGAMPPWRWTWGHREGGSRCPPRPPTPGRAKAGEARARPAGTPGSLLRPVSSQPLGTMTLLLSTSPVFEVEAQGGGRLSKGGQSEVGRPDSNPGPRCVRALAPHCAWSLFCRVLPTLGTQWPPSPCVHCGTGCGQRNKLIRCFLPPPPPAPRSWWTGCSARNGRLSPPPCPEPARGAPVLWTPRAGHRLPLAQGLRVALDCSDGPPTLLPLPWLGQRCRGWSQLCWVIGWWRGQWEEPQSTLQERKLSQGGHPAAQAAGVQLQPGRGVCRPGRVAPSCLPPPPTSGSGLSVQGAKGRAAPVAASQATRGPLSPLSDLTAAWPESRHVRWSHGADLDASLSRSERGMRSWPAPSCKASSCV